MRRRMVNEVSNIIYNSLLTHGAVHLPSVGTLYVVRKGATMNGKSRVAAPEYRVDFSSSREARSVVDAIAQCASITQKSAEDIYMLWLDKVRDGDSIEIVGVGTLRNKSFTTDNTLLAQLNPMKGVDVAITYQPRRSRVALYVTMVVAVVLGVALYLFMFPTKSATQHPPIAKTDIVADSSNVETPTIETEVSDAYEVIDTADTETVAEDTESTDLVDIPWYERDDIRHYVVVGSYKSRRNAEGAMKSIAESLNGEIECYIFKRGKMHTLAVYGSADVESCEAFVASHKSEFAQAWVYSSEE